MHARVSMIPYHRRQHAPQESKSSRQIESVSLPLLVRSLTTHFWPKLPPSSQPWRGELSIHYSTASASIKVSLSPPLSTPHAPSIAPRHRLCSPSGRCCCLSSTASSSSSSRIFLCSSLPLAVFEGSTNALEHPSSGARGR